MGRVRGRPFDTGGNIKPPNETTLMRLQPTVEKRQRTVVAPQATAGCTLAVRCTCLYVRNSTMTEVRPSAWAATGDCAASSGEAAISTRRVLALGLPSAAFVALAVTAQTYLSMLGTTAMRSGGCWRGS